MKQERPSIHGSTSGPFPGAWCVALCALPLFGCGVGIVATNLEQESELQVAIAPASSATGAPTTMTPTETKTPPLRPAIDLRAPASTRTATFALG